MRRHARVWFAIAALASLFAFAGTASADFTYRGAFGSPFVGGGLLTSGRAAVEQSTGNLFLVNSRWDRVHVYLPKGDGTAKLLRTFGTDRLSKPWGIAIDEEAGQTYVYVADADNDRIVKYASDEQAVPSFTLDASFTSPAKGAGAGQIGNFKVALAIDPATHDLLVADNANKRIVRFDGDGGFLSSFDGSSGGAAFDGPIDLAVNSAGDVYVVDANGPNIAEREGTSKVLRYSSAGAFKSQLAAVGTTERPATVAVNPFDDSVFVTADQDNVYEAAPPPFQPVIGHFDSADDPLPAPQLAALAQYATVSGLAVASSPAADRLYVVLSEGSYFGSPYGEPHVQAFRQGRPAAPALLGQSASPTSNETTLRAAIHPNSLSTKYWFEYGPTAAYGQSTSVRSIPAGEEEVGVKAEIAGLAPGATYHYRVIAENAAGKVEGPDRSFTTDTGQVQVTCPNDVFRVGFAAQLPNCRAYEMVSPSFKNGTDVAGYRRYSPSSPTRSSVTGDRAVLTSEVSFGGNGSNYLFTSYLSGRGAVGWASQGISPVASYPRQFGASALVMQAFSGDLRYSVFAKTNPPLTADAAPNTMNLYRRDNLTGAVVNLTPVGTPEGSGWQPAFGAASEDFSRIAFESGVAMTPGAVSERPNVYEWVDGQTRLVAVLPNGEPASEGSVIGPISPEPASFGGVYDKSYVETAVSEDGSRIVWSDVATEQLYLRIDGTTTKHVSKSQRTNDSGPGGTDPNGPRPAIWQYSTPDGSVVYFTSTEKLTNDATASGIKPDLYAYHVDSGLLEDLSVSPDPGAPADVEGMFGASDDGEYVYFGAAGGLTPDAIVDPGKVNLYLWHAGEVEYVTTLGGGKENSVESFNWQNNSFTKIKPSRVSRDGRVAIFRSQEQLTAYDNAGLFQIYRYDAGADELACMSCNPRTESSTAEASTSVQVDTGPLYTSFLDRILSSDGRRAFFNTSEALVPQDTNGQVDVYQWEDGKARLISSGQSSAPSYFAEASASGDDVFFVTRERLSPADTDDNVDLYDAKAGGGFVAAEGAGDCRGEDCQPAGSIPPSATTPGSSAVGGQANAKPRRNKHARCAKPRKSKAKASAKAKARCAKRQAAKKRAGADRGGAK